MVNIGDTCTVTRFGAALWVAMRPEPDGRWHMTGKRIDEKGRARRTSCTAGQGDIQVVVPSPTFSPGAEIAWQGEHGVINGFVLEDRGDLVEVGVPERRVPTKGTEFIHIPSGNVGTLSKGEVVLATLF